MVDLGQSLCHWSRLRLWVGLTQVIAKINYYHSFKTQFRGRPRARHLSIMGLIVDLDQHKDKNGYYHSFKTRLGG